MNEYLFDNVIIKKVNSPNLDNSGSPVVLSESTILERKKKIIALMKEQGYSSLFVYADKEHSANFEYLVGFMPRFEEALLVFNVNGTSTLILGNENFGKTKYSRISSEGIHCPLFSLPNQPDIYEWDFSDYIKKANADDSGYVGIVGWKLFNQHQSYYDVPNFILDGIKHVINEKKLRNATDLFISPSYGVRTTNNAEEILHYEYGASLASDCVLKAMDSLVIGVSELEVSNQLSVYGQYNSVVTICAFGNRFENAYLFPKNHLLEKGNKVALTVGYKGGLSSRSGYAVSNYEELEMIDQGYIEEVVVPYFNAYCYWLTNLKVGIKAKDFFNGFEEVYPSDKYGWNLCPGHLVADEEWLSSPFYKNSDTILKSGMILQVDFIPIQPPHHGVSAESTVVLADSDLRNQIKEHYPKLWSRFVSRRLYLANELGIALHEDVLPMASTVGYLRPYMLNDGYALCRTKEEK